MRGEDLTVAEAADVLGTSPQTVRTLLRKGELRGERHPWGSRFVWKVSHEGLEEFLSEYGRLEGRRRARVRSPAPPGPVVPPLPAPEPETTAGREVSVAARAGSEEATRGTDGAARPFVLRPRATKGVPLERVPAGSDPDDVVLTPGEGDLLIMGGACQREWLHGVPRAVTDRPRISLTWRWTSRRGRPDTNPTYYDGRHFSDADRQPGSRRRPT